jgi:hypothetical protein
MKRSGHNEELFVIEMKGARNTGTDSNWGGQSGGLEMDFMEWWYSTESSASLTTLSWGVIERVHFSIGGSVEKSRQRRSRLFSVLTYYAYAPRGKMAAALLDGFFEPTRSLGFRHHPGQICTGTSQYSTLPWREDYFEPTRRSEKQRKSGA